MRFRPSPVLTAALGLLALLLFCWPFVHSPRPTLHGAYFHVFATWAASIGLLWWISRGFAGGGRGGGPDG